MSKLQQALHAYPPCSFVTKAMLADVAATNRQLDAGRSREVANAKAYQASEGCSWGDAQRVCQGLTSA